MIWVESGLGTSISLDQLRTCEVNQALVGQCVYVS